MNSVFWAAGVALVCLASGCTQVPEIDQRFLARSVDVGMATNVARSRVEARQFHEAPPPDLSHYSWFEGVNAAAPSQEDLPEVAQHRIGFVALEGHPVGALTCFERSYEVLFAAAGRRLICWTSVEDRITWRQAGWRGGAL